MSRVLRHRRWLLNPPTHEPTREEFGLAPIPVHPAKNQIDAAMAMVKKKVELVDLAQAGVHSSQHETGYSRGIPTSAGRGHILV